MLVKLCIMILASEGILVVTQVAHEKTCTSMLDHAGIYYHPYPINDDIFAIAVDGLEVPMSLYDFQLDVNSKDSSGQPQKGMNAIKDLIFFKWRLTDIGGKHRPGLIATYGDAIHFVDYLDEECNCVKCNPCIITLSYVGRQLGHLYVPFVDSNLVGAVPSYTKQQLENQRKGTTGNTSLLILELLEFQIDVSARTFGINSRDKLFLDKDSYDLLEEQKGFYAARWDGSAGDLFTMVVGFRTRKESATSGNLVSEYFVFPLCERIRLVYTEIRIPLPSGALPVNIQVFSLFKGTTEAPQYLSFLFNKGPSESKLLMYETRYLLMDIRDSRKREYCTNGTKLLQNLLGTGGKFVCQGGSVSTCEANQPDRMVSKEISSELRAKSPSRDHKFSLYHHFAAYACKPINRAMYILVHNTSQTMAVCNFGTSFALNCETAVEIKFSRSPGQQSVMLDEHRALVRVIPPQGVSSNYVSVPLINCSKFTDCFKCENIGLDLMCNWMSPGQCQRGNRTSPQANLCFQIVDFSPQEMKLMDGLMDEMPITIVLNGNNKTLKASTVTITIGTMGCRPNDSATDITNITCTLDGLVAGEFPIQIALTETWGRPTIALSENLFKVIDENSSTAPRTVYFVLAALGIVFLFFAATIIVQSRKSPAWSDSSPASAIRSTEPTDPNVRTMGSATEVTDSATQSTSTASAPAVASAKKKAPSHATTPKSAKAGDDALVSSSQFAEIITRAALIRSKGDLDKKGKKVTSRPAKR